MSVVWLMICCISSVVPTSMKVDGVHKRIEPHEVNIRNYEQYVAQLQRNLPIGTPLQQVEKYLTDNNITYSYRAKQAEGLPQKDCRRRIAAMAGQGWSYSLYA